MPQHIFSSPEDGSMSPELWYQTVSAMPGFIYDAAQAAAINELDILWHQLVNFKSKRNHFLGRSLFSPEVPKGLYFWGGVGRGKSFLMDAFYACVPYRRKRRIHFHNFMAEVHHEMKVLAAEKDPLIALADNIAKATRLLCFDEFHVSDIADAMILSRLLEALFARGVVLIVTSNYPPDGLYPNGLQRQNFLPAIELLKHELNVLRVDGGSDYRLRVMIREPVFMEPDNAQNEAAMGAIFQRLCSGALQNSRHIEVQGRQIAVKKLALGIVWFDFQDICGGPRGQADYLDIARRFHTVFVSHIPKMTAADAAEAQRFTWLADVFYDARVKLVVSAAASAQDIHPEGVQSGEFSRTVSRLMEMQSKSYLELPHQSASVNLTRLPTGVEEERRAHLK